MRRLGIRPVGTSTALHELTQALEPYGHDLGAQEPAIDLLIEDGTQPVAQDSPGMVVMSLRLAIGPLSECGLPALQIRCYDRVSQLLAVLDVAPPACGNGQQLRRQAVTQLVEWIVRQVSGFARNPGHFAQRASASPFQSKACKAWRGWPTCIALTGPMSRRCCKKPGRRWSNSWSTACGSSPIGRPWRSPASA